MPLFSIACKTAVGSLMALLPQIKTFISISPSIMMLIRNEPTLEAVDSAVADRLVFRVIREESR